MYIIVFQAFKQRGRQATPDLECTGPNLESRERLKTLSTNHLISHTHTGLSMIIGWLFPISLKIEHTSNRATVLGRQGPLGMACSVDIVSLQKA
jgi:hypothetical protein